MQELQNQHNIDKKRQKRQICFHKFGYFWSLHGKDKDIVFKSLRFQCSTFSHTSPLSCKWSTKTVFHF